MTETLSPEVRAQFRAWSERGHTPRAASCAHCGAAYTALKPWSKYCSHTCATRAWRQTKKDGATPMTPDTELDHFWAWETFVGPSTVAQFLEQAVAAHLDTLPPLPGPLRADLLRALLRHIAVNPETEPDPPFGA